MVGPAVGQIIDRVHLFCGQWFLRWILHHKLLAIGLCQPFGGEGVAVAILDFEGFGIAASVFRDFLKAGQDDGRQTFVQLSALIDCAVNVCDILHVHTGVQGVRNLHNALFAHSVHQKVCLRVQKNGTLHAVGPVVIVPQSAQTGLNTANQNGYIFVGLPDQVAVNGGGVIGPPAHDAAGGEGVCFPAVPGDGIVVDHGVHVAAADQKAQTRAAEDVNGFWIPPVRLGDNDNAVAAVFQDPADDGVAEGGVIYVGVANNIDKIRLLDAPVQHFLFGDR